MAQKNKNGPLGTQSSADAQRSEMFEASVLKSASMEAQEIVQEGEKEARKIVEEARHSSVDTQLDAYRRAAKRAAALEAAVARRENRDRLLRYRTDVYKRQLLIGDDRCFYLFCGKKVPFVASAQKIFRRHGHIIAPHFQNRQRLLRLLCVQHFLQKERKPRLQQDAHCAEHQLADKRGPVSYTHLDVYKSQIFS